MACGQPILETPEVQQSYIASVRRRLYKTLLVSAGLSMIPVIGILPGIIYYRLQIVAPFKSYVPTRQGVFLKIPIKIASFFLIGLQAIPIVGTMSLPMIALLNYTVYSRYFAKQLNSSGASRAD